MLPGPHNLSASASDVRRTLDSVGAAPDVLVGHSLGGKVSLQFVQVVDAFICSPAWVIGWRVVRN